MKPLIKCFSIISGLIFLFVAGQTAARANNLTFVVSTTTSPLTTPPGSSSGPFEVGFLLLDASNSGDGNNTVNITNFGFGGGSAGSVDTLDSIGGYSGDLNSTVTLTDNSSFNGLISAFTPGSTFSFTVTMTTNPDATVDPSMGIPGDQFGFFIFDSTLTPISTTNTCGPGQSGVCALMLATIQSNGSVDLESFSATDRGLSDVDTSYQQAAVATPEPSTLFLLGAGLVASLGLKRRLRSIAS